MLGPILVVVGIILVLLSLAQHFAGVVRVDHLAAILAVIGVIAILPGAWLFTRRSS